MKKFFLLTGASFRTQARWAKGHVYTWLVLGPIVLGMTYITARRVGESFAASRPSVELMIALVTSTVACLILLSLSRATSEVYHIRRPELFFESLPVAPIVYLHTALAARFARTAVAAGVMLTACWILDAVKFSGLESAYALTVLVALTAVAETYAALNWVHWGHTRKKTPALVAILVLPFASAAAGSLFVLSIRRDELPPRMRLWVLANGAVATVLLYALVRTLHARWRASDLEYARRLEIASHRTVLKTVALWRRFDPRVAAQLARDLQLTIRGFSSAVYVALTVAASLVAVLPLVLSSNLLLPAAISSSWFDATWLPPVMAAKAVCTFVTVTLAALLPVLVNHELPHFWLERAAGTSGLEMWQAKLWYTRLITSLSPLVVWLVAVAAGGIPAFYIVPLLAECVWIWWLVSSLIGSFSFEMPARPGLSIIFMVTIGGAFGLLSAMLWPFGLIVYAFAMEKLTQRGRHRARYFLMMGED